MLSLLFALVCLYTPPEGWQPSRPKNMTKVEIGFVGKGSGEFNPSMNLVSEQVTCTLKEYVKAVKGVHVKEANTTWRDLGEFEMKGGLGRLTEVRKKTPSSDLVLLQAILLKETTAYILTAAVAKKDFLPFHKEIVNSLRSLEIADDLWSALPNENLREKLAATDHWETFQKIIDKETKKQGPYWQFLALKEGHEKLVK